MKKSFHSLLSGTALVAVLLTLAACSNETDQATDVRVPLQIGAADVQQDSRAIIEGTTLPEECQYGIFAMDNNSSDIAVENGINTRVDYVKGISYLSAPVYLPENSEIPVYAYYPYNEEYNYVGALQNMPLMAEKQIDYLYGTSVNPNGGLAFASFYAPKVSIRFKHAMARVTFHIRKEESNTNAYFLPNISLINVWSSAVLNLYMGTVDLFKGWVTLIGKPDNNILETASQVATVEFLVLPMNSEKVDWDISLGMGELYNEYDLFVMMPPFNWEGGKQYTYEVTIRNGSMSIGEAVITPWENNDKEGITVGDSNYVE